MYQGCDKCGHPSRSVHVRKWGHNQNDVSENRYFGHAKSHSGLERTAIEGMVVGSAGRGRPPWRWKRDVKDTLCLNVHEAGKFARS